MNRRQKIIVSVVGIFIVLLALVGLTYAYFLTQIEYNDNPTSITLTTKNLSLVYGDGNNKIITKTNIVPDTVIGTKDFTVTNTGGDTSYVVIIDGDGDIDNGITPIRVTYVTAGKTTDNTPYEEGQVTSFITNDFVYTLTCTSDLGEDCNEQNYETTLPMNGGIILGNDIKEGDVHRYNLTVTYKDNGKNQTDDMNKAFNAQINIDDIGRINPYSNNKNSIAYNIINNSLLNKNGTKLSATPPTKVAEEASSIFLEKGKEQKFPININTIWAYGNTYDDVMNCYNGNCNNGAVNGAPTSCLDVKNKYVYFYDPALIYDVLYVSGCDGDTPYYLGKVESVLSATQDDYGTSFYYRGLVEDNYVNFAKMCWRIVRIDGLGNTKLILEDQYAKCDDEDYTGAWNIPASNGEDLTMNGDQILRIGNFGYDNSTYSGKTIASYLNPETEPEKSMVNAFKYFQKTNLAGYTDKLTTGNWCYNDIAYNDEIGTTLIDKESYYNSGTQFYYDSYVRLVGKTGKNPTLKCNGTVMNKYKDNTDMLVSALTADEIMYAGGKYDGNRSYYLINNYQYDNYLWSWSLSPRSYNGNRDYASAFLVGYNGSVSYDYVVNDYDIYSFRPAVSLEPGVGIVDGGDGTKNNPYEIEM